MAHFFIPYGSEAEHARILKAGIDQMVEGFSAYVCGVCDGRGSYEQTYTAGCGGGYYRSTGPCNFCGSTGLRQGGMWPNPAPDSVREQVMQAGRTALADGGRE